MYDDSIIIEISVREIKKEGEWNGSSEFFFFYMAMEYKMSSVFYSSFEDKFKTDILLR